MNTNKLKSFAKEARLILLEGVKQKVAYWGFDKNGKVTEEVTPIEGGFLFRENVFNDSTVPPKWRNLKSAIHNHTVEDIVEEAAYTWFNRLIAIKILEKNNYIDPVYDYVSQQLKEPAILLRARKGNTEGVREDEKKLLNEYLLESKDEEAFELLLTAFCRNQKLLNRIFGHIDDYTELLLPNNLLSGNGIIEHINSTNAIEAAEYKEVELIGWLYQFYIADKKDEVFAGFKKKKKARPEDIPAATQIFTPKWIVKYMVENTVGRIWLDKHPDSPIKSDMKYLVEPADKENYKPEPIIQSVTELTLMDPACGSGHILVEGFELLIKMYLEEGYTKKNAVEGILTNNVYGIDIDDRASQLANFALLLKAATYYPAILTSDTAPRIYSFPEGRDISRAEINMFLGNENITHASRLKDIFDLLKQGKNLGSVIKLELSDELQKAIKVRHEYYETIYRNHELDFAEEAYWVNIRQYIVIILHLSQRYTSVVANPPYMGQKNMNDTLKEYVNERYSMSKSDLFAVFMEVCWNLISKKSFMGMINQHSWMFLSSFVKLRDYLLRNYQIESMLHLGPRAFNEIGGEVVQSTAFVLKGSISGNMGIYNRLIDFDSEEKEKNFLEEGTVYRNIYQSEYFNLPGSPIVYWINKKSIEIISSNMKLSKYADCKSGMSTSDNKRFVRFWFEVMEKSTGLKYENSQEAVISKKKWFPYNKGGNSKKWFGNNELVINWYNDGEEIKLAVVDNPNDPGTTHWSRRIYNTEYFFNSGLTWSKVSSDGFSVRFLETGYISDVGGCCIYFNNNKELQFYVLGAINSVLNIPFIKEFSPTINYEIYQIENFPLIESEKISEVNDIVEKIINIAKRDWNSRETSWDFQKNELIRYGKNLNTQIAFKNYCNYWHNQYFILHGYEEKLNRIFIDIYGLQNVLTPNVRLKDITILQNETYINENNELIFKNDEVIKQFISYAVGCIMGRYSLDKDGLILANQGDELEEYKTKVPNPTFMPDENGLLPIMGSNCNFSDDVVIRFTQFLETALSPDTLTENLNFVQESLDMDIEKFFTDKFWQYHCKMYQKKPIYWLFSSPKGAFKVLAYMHRMNKFTVQKIRNNYLIKHLVYLRNEIAKMEKNQGNLSRLEAKKLDKLRSDEIECREYDKLVKDYADRQIEFDLDDGVTVNYAKFEEIVEPIK